MRRLLDSYDPDENNVLDRTTPMPTKDKELPVTLIVGVSLALLSALVIVAIICRICCRRRNLDTIQANANAAAAASGNSGSGSSALYQRAPTTEQASAGASLPLGPVTSANLSTQSTSTTSASSASQRSQPQQTLGGVGGYDSHPNHPSHPAAGARMPLQSHPMYGAHPHPHSQGGFYHAPQGYPQHPQAMRAMPMPELMYQQGGPRQPMQYALYPSGPGEVRAANQLAQAMNQMGQRTVVYPPFGPPASSGASRPPPQSSAPLPPPPPQMSEYQSSSGSSLIYSHGQGQGTLKGKPMNADQEPTEETPLQMPSAPPEEVI